MSEHRWLSTAQAAVYLSVNPKTLRRWAKAGMVPFHRLPGGRDLRFHTAELDAFLGLDIDSASQRARNTDFTRPREEPDDEAAA